MSMENYDADIFDIVYDDELPDSNAEGPGERNLRPGPDPLRQEERQEAGPRQRHPAVNGSVRRIQVSPFLCGRGRF